MTMPLIILDWTQTEQVSGKAGAKIADRRGVWLRSCFVYYYALKLFFLSANVGAADYEPVLMTRTVIFWRRPWRRCYASCVLCVTLPKAHAGARNNNLYYFITFTYYLL